MLWLQARTTTISSSRKNSRQFVGLIAWQHFSEWRNRSVQSKLPDPVSNVAHCPVVFGIRLQLPSTPEPWRPATRHAFAPRVPSSENLLASRKFHERRNLLAQVQRDCPCDSAVLETPPAAHRNHFFPDIGQAIPAQLCWLQLPSPSASLRTVRGDDARRRTQSLALQPRVEKSVEPAGDVVEAVSAPS